MNKVLITGISGFVGQNLKNYLRHSFEINSLSIRYSFKNLIKIKEDYVIHLAGKAHDLRKISKPEEYYEANYEVTKQIFNAFLKSNAKKFIFISSVKAVADSIQGALTELELHNPQTAYGKSKLLAEQYIQSQIIPEGKFFYILRPCIIHGPGNKGNLNLLYEFIKNGIPYPLGAYQNKRSLLSVENICFVIKELLENNIPSGVYNVSDDVPLSTEEIIRIIGIGIGKEIRIWKMPKKIIQWIACMGNILHLPLNSERLKKLTEDYIVSNSKLIKALQKKMPVSSKDGLLKTIYSFKK